MRVFSALALLLAGLTGTVQATERPVAVRPALQAAAARARLQPMPTSATHRSGETVAVRRRLSPAARGAVIGGVIGAAAGAVVCTAISNIAEEEGGFHTCTGTGYLLTGGAGAAVGAVVGALIGGRR